MFTPSLTVGRFAADTLFFDSNESGQYPNDPKFEPLKQSFLHKLIDCPDQELKYHPLVSIIVDKKLRFYRWWYVISFFFYLFFLCCLGYALIQASTVCDSNIWLYQNPTDRMRGVCEMICLFYLIFFIFNEVVEFYIEWTQVYELKRIKNEESRDIEEDENSDEESQCTEEEFNKEETMNREEEPQVSVKYLVEKTHFSIVYIKWRKAIALFNKLDAKLKYLLNAFPKYFDGAYNIIDWSALISSFLLILLRAASSHLQWTFAGLSFIFFSISLLKYTRISPALGAYVSGVFRIFLIDIPRFFVIVIIVLIAYIGGIHLAARQQPSSNQSLCSVAPYQVCNNSLSEFFWFNQELTCAYDLRRPLLSGLIFMLDGGPGNHVEDILQDNLFFTLIYLAFSFTIIVVLLNILIAQLSETYSSIIKENNYHYKIALVVTLELKSNLAFWFGRRFRKYTSIKSLTIPGAHWYQLIKGE